jgi:hypothetical protein
MNTNNRDGVLKTVLQKLLGGARLHQDEPVRRSSCLQHVHLARSPGLLRCAFTD